MKKTKNQIKVNQNELTKKEQRMVLGGDDSLLTYTCTKCQTTITAAATAAPPSTCLVCGTVGGFAVSGRGAT